jgi:hypothetical protein
VSNAPCAEIKQLNKHLGGVSGTADLNKSGDIQEEGEVIIIII